MSFLYITSFSFTFCSCREMKYRIDPLSYEMIPSLSTLHSPQLRAHSKSRNASFFRHFLAHLPYILANESRTLFPLCREQHTVRSYRDWLIGSAFLERSCDRRRRDAVRELPHECEQALGLLVLRDWTSLGEGCEAGVGHRWGEGTA